MRRSEIVLHGNPPPDIKRAEVHIHTPLSDGVHNIHKIVKEAVKQELDAIVFTDHHNITAGYVAKNLRDRYSYPVEVYIGSEIGTKEGHVLGINLTDNVKKGMSVEKTIEHILYQDAYAVIPHPNYQLTSSVPFTRIFDIAKNGIPIGIEVFNASSQDLRFIEWLRGLPSSNKEALLFYQSHEKILGAATAGTDAHYRSVGRGRTGYPKSMTFFEALQTKQTIPMRIPKWERGYSWDIFTHEVRNRISEIPQSFKTNQENES